MSTTKKEIVKEWITALKKLRENPASNVSCPNCQIGRLKIITGYTDDLKTVDEYIVCSNCNATFSVTGPC